jgi:hypothetical protein
MADKKKPNSMLAYTRGKSDSDKAKTDSYYNDKFSKVVANEKQYSLLDAAFNPKTAEKLEKASIATSRAMTRLPGEKAYQKSWIAKGAKANALAQMKLKKKSK